jgi:hypothetical protein
LVIDVAAAAVLEPAEVGVRMAVSPTTASVSWTGAGEAGADPVAGIEVTEVVAAGAVCACADAGAGTVFCRDAR